MSLNRWITDSPIIAAISVVPPSVQESTTETALRVSSAPSHCEKIREERVKPESKPPRQAPQGRSLSDSIWADKENVEDPREVLNVHPQTPQPKNDAGDNRSIYASIWATEDTKGAVPFSICTHLLKASRTSTYDAFSRTKGCACDSRCCGACASSREEVESYAKTQHGQTGAINIHHTRHHPKN